MGHYEDKTGASVSAKRFREASTMKSCLTLIATSVVLLASGVALAHHSRANFELDRTKASHAPEFRVEKLVKRTAFRKLLAGEIHGSSDGDYRVLLAHRGN